MNSRVDDRSIIDVNEIQNAAGCRYGGQLGIDGSGTYDVGTDSTNRR